MRTNTGILTFTDLSQTQKTRRGSELGSFLDEMNVIRPEELLGELTRHFQEGSGNHSRFFMDYRYRDYASVSRARRMMPVYGAKGLTSGITRRANFVELLMCKESELVGTGFNENVFGVSYLNGEDTVTMSDRALELEIGKPGITRPVRIAEENKDRLCRTLCRLWEAQEKDPSTRFVILTGRAGERSVEILRQLYMLLPDRLRLQMGFETNVAAADLERIQNARLPIYILTAEPGQSFDSRRWAFPIVECEWARPEQYPCDENRLALVRKLADAMNESLAGRFGRAERTVMYMKESDVSSFKFYGAIVQKLLEGATVAPTPEKRKAPGQEGRTSAGNARERRGGAASVSAGNVRPPIRGTGSASAGSDSSAPKETAPAPEKAKVPEIPAWLRDIYPSRPVRPDKTIADRAEEYASKPWLSDIAPMRSREKGAATTSKTVREGRSTAAGAGTESKGTGVPKAGGTRPVTEARPAAPKADAAGIPAGTAKPVSEVRPVAPKADPAGIPAGRVNPSAVRPAAPKPETSFAAAPKPVPEKRTDNLSKPQAEKASAAAPAQEKKTVTDTRNVSENRPASEPRTAAAGKSADSELVELTNMNRKLRRENAELTRANMALGEKIRRLEKGQGGAQTGEKGVVLNTGTGTSDDAGAAGDGTKRTYEQKLEGRARRLSQNNRALRKQVTLFGAMATFLFLLLVILLIINAMERRKGGQATETQDGIAAQTQNEAGESVSGTGLSADNVEDASNAEAASNGQAAAETGENQTAAGAGGENASAQSGPGASIGTTDAWTAIQGSDPGSSITWAETTGRLGQPVGYEVHFHIRFAADTNGTGLSEDSSLPYIGVYVNSKPADTDEARYYQWQEQSALDPANGLRADWIDVPGIDYYMHIAYASDANGTDFSTTDAAGRGYVGYYISGHAEGGVSPDSGSYSDYTWIQR